MSNCPLSISSRLIDGCFGEYSALNGFDSEITNRSIRVNPINPFFKIISEETRGEAICSSVRLYSENSECLIILKVIKLREIIMKKAVIVYIP
tara:strand:- start:1223 stop:1501 length:279 start_codon:yes stop_codon:yes gene_type:complete